MSHMLEPKRCHWVTDDTLYRDYHDHEWGRPVFCDRTLFEFLILEGMQAGLSWLTILKKRDRYRQVFYQFDAVKMAELGNEDLLRLLQDPGIIRNRLKIQAAIQNARAFLEVSATFGSFSKYLWGFVDGAPLKNQWQKPEDVPTATPISGCLSQDLQRRGFKFVGSTICYAYMQAVGMVNDHLTTCFCYNAE